MRLHRKKTMNTEKFISENFPQDKAQQFADILKDSISDYIGKITVQLKNG